MSISHTLELDSICSAALQEFPVIHIESLEIYDSETAAVRRKYFRPGDSQILYTAPQLVLPGFTRPESTLSTLSLLGRWKEPSNLRSQHLEGRMRLQERVCL